MKNDKIKEQELLEEYLQFVIEEALAKVDNMKAKDHKNLMGNKKKYVKAIMEALKNA